MLWSACWDHKQHLFIIPIYINITKLKNIPKISSFQTSTSFTAFCLFSQNYNFFLCQLSPLSFVLFFSRNVIVFMNQNLKYQFKTKIPNSLQKIKLFSIVWMHLILFLQFWIQPCGVVGCYEICLRPAESTLWEADLKSALCSNCRAMIG